jgi:uncharacterized membrane protein YdjX (TVP38/TMEM64 family)
MDRPDAPRTIWPRLAVAVGIVAAIAAFYALGLQRYFGWDFLRSHLTEWRAEVADNLLLALAVFFAIYVAVTALSLPVAVPLTIVGALLFGRWVGTGVISLASTLGATLAFLSSRYLLRDWVQRRFAARLEPLNRGVERDGGFYLFMLRLVPLVPFFLINLGMGLTPIRVSTYVFVSWAGMLLGTFLYVNAAASLTTIESPSDLLSWQVLGPLALLGIVSLVVRKLVVRKTHP